MSFLNKILEKSNSYNYYKHNFFKLQKSNEKLNKQLKNKNNKINELNKKYKQSSAREEWFKFRFEKEYIYIDTDTFFAKSYVNPFTKVPFPYQSIWGFSFMDHFAKHLVKEIESKNKPLASIILPVYNYETHIIEAIQTVLNQSYSNFELIIIDDASEDNTIDLIKSIEDERIKLIENNKHQGFSHCRNLALNQANGEYIFYLNMGDFWTEKYLTAMMSAYLEVGDADAIYSGHYVFERDSKRLLGVMFGVYNKQLLYNKNYISLSSFSHKKVISDEIKFDETLTFLEDWYFITEIAKNCKMYSVPIIQSKSFNNLDYEDSQIEQIHNKIGVEQDDFSLNYDLKKKVSIIIPSYELLDDLKDCLDTIFSFNSNLIEVIVVDNASNNAVRNYLRQLANDNKIKYIQNDINYSFTYAVEQGISISDEDSDILLLNNDAIITKGAIEAMQYYAYNLENCGIIVPQEVLYPNDDRINFHIPYANPNFECNVSASRAHDNIINVPLYHNGEILELTFAPFFCTYIKREVYDKTLGLDAELGRHYNSDRIYSDYLRHVLKLKVYHINDAKVYHRSQASTKTLENNNKKEYEMIFVKNSWEEDLAKELGYEIPIWRK